MLLSITVVWGSTFVISKELLADISPFTYIALRFGIASLLFAALVFRSIRIMPRSAVIHGSILGFLLFAGFAAQTVGLQYTSASKSAFITGMMVVFTPVCQLLIERRPPKIGNVIGVVLVTAGLYLLTSPAGSEFNRGDGLTLICAITFGLYIVYLDIYGKQHDASHLTLVQFVSTFVLGTASALLFEQSRVNMTTGAATALGYLIIFPTIVALYVQARFQKDTTPTRSAIIFSIEPVLAAGFAYLLLNERIGGIGMVGGGLILTGLLVSELWDALIRHGRAGESLE